MELRDTDMPEVFRAADRSSLLAQRRFLRSSATQLILLALGAAFGAYSWRWRDPEIDAAALIAGLAFALAGTLRAGMQRRKPERGWYDGRAVAESAKTMAWRYAVAGKPFPLELAERSADLEMVRRLRDLPLSTAGLELVPSSEAGAQITSAMRSLRQMPLMERKTAYREGRLRDQQAWYARKALSNRQQGDLWNRLLLSLEAAGAVAAVLIATTALSLHVLPLTGAVLAGATAWLQTKQHETLASAYALASLDLATVLELMEGVVSEGEWASFVDDAENAVSREHTMWQARRSQGRSRADEAKP